ncbi:MAG: hypothetical protein ACOYN3_00405 [Acidimicrobiia bacterium]
MSKSSSVKNEIVVSDPHARSLITDLAAMTTTLGPLADQAVASGTLVNALANGFPIPVEKRLILLAPDKDVVGAIKQVLDTTGIGVNDRAPLILNAGAQPTDRDNRRTRLACQIAYETSYVTTIATQGLRHGNNVMTPPIRIVNDLAAIGIELARVADLRSDASRLYRNGMSDSRRVTSMRSSFRNAVSLLTALSPSVVEQQISQFSKRSAHMLGALLENQLNGSQGRVNIRVSYRARTDQAGAQLAVAHARQLLAAIHDKFPMTDLEKLVTPKNVRPWLEGETPTPIPTRTAYSFIPGMGSLPR